MNANKKFSGKNLRYAGVDVLTHISIDTTTGEETTIPFVDIRIPKRPRWNDSVLHYVKEGDMLDALAYYYYGKEELWWIIADQNKIDDPDDLRMGDVLEIPPLRVAAQY